jgi:alpha-tubulin suppressor-like RCC1 family protein
VQVSNISNWRKVILGAETVLGITDQNTMWGWGSRHLIWTGTETNSVSPVRVTTADDWLDFSFAQNSSVSTVLGIKTNGTLWAWGENARGQLGLGDTTDRSSPVQVGASGGWIAVSTSNNNSSLEGQTLAIQGTGGSGSLWAWGQNSSGELGIGNTANQSTPVRVGLLNTWAKVYSCGPCSFAIRNNRTLWSWGSNSLGVLGFGGTSRSSPVQVGALTDWVKVRSDSGSTIGLRSNGTLWGWGTNFGTVGIGLNAVNGFIGINPALVFASSPVQIGSATDWSDFELFTTGSDPTILALRTTGTLWVWGSNSQGLLTRVGTK